MPRKRLMSFDGKPYFRWKKMREGKMFYVRCDELQVPPPNWTEHDPINIAAANSWWERKLAELLAVDPQAEVKVVVDNFVNARVAQALDLDGPIGQAEMNVEVAVAETPKRPSPKLNGWSGKTSDHEDGQGDCAGRISNVLAPKNKIDSDKSLANNITKFVELAQQKAKPATIKELRYFLGEFDGVFNADVSTVNEQSVQKFYLWLCKRELEPTSRKKRWIVFRRFVRWLWESNQCNLPEILPVGSFDSTSPPRQSRPIPWIKSRRSWHRSRDGRNCMHC